MVRLVKIHWHILATLLLFASMWLFIQLNTDAIRAVLQSTHPALSVIVFILLGIVLVMIPTASLLPFMPLAVAQWGWPMTAAMTLCAWVIGGQILFELARTLGKPFVARFVPAQRQTQLSRVVQGESLLHSILIRFIVHGDMVSYAFGLFTNISRLEFGIASAIGMAPAAILYAYVGTLPFTFQLGMMTVAVMIMLLYWIIRSRKIRMQKMATALPPISWSKHPVPGGDSTNV